MRGLLGIEMASWSGVRYLHDGLSAYHRLPCSF
jgi:hypothetical protein